MSSGHNGTATTRVLVSSLPEQLKMSHEHVLLGNYDAAQVYYAGLIGNVAKRAKVPRAPNAALWNSARDALAREHQLVRDVAAELGAFSATPGASLGSARRQEGDRCVGGGGA
jgi:hypothetical protein